ncbi:adenylate/guanylate cyclase domain-containing protein [Hoeflea poritis]|uniref:Adenylate/guanylate cyclase domain-containing protein n=1 Tax=Hoeflea poritis TaxID=2993659 RepID=A0ABT4VRU7_9HYPH|nr:adenylate/guanylate cyclase domain-containing protein [Hoeflea poritis]MDA4846930.1 adenylate/guanylate cyclase domain-containing protein [Hoeflea poritis]
MSERIREHALERLKQTEENGLRLAITCRTAVIVAAVIWYAGATFATDSEPRFAGLVVLFFFAAFGIAHLAVIGTRFDRWWLKYAIYTLDTLGICALFALIPISRTGDVPQIIAFRAYGIYYLFPIIALATLSLSWRLVIWAGTVAVAGWWLAFFWVINGMENVLSWGDLPPNANKNDYETVFLSIDFIGRGNRIEETGFLLAGALIMALAVFRARRVFFAQIAAEVRQDTERRARERISNMLGRYVPQAIAERLINEPEALKPQVRHATVLVLDIADFSKFAANRDPQEVIEALDSFLAAATDIVSSQDGIVISFTGDGLLATFNTPMEIQAPEVSAVQAAVDLARLAETTDYRVRIGIASGNVASGNVGSSQRQAFTVYGEVVNLAARLESLAKVLKKTVLFDGATQEKVRHHMTTRSLGAQAIRGMDRQIEVFTLE